MIIAQISDTHLDAEGLQGAARQAALERCVADINRLVPLPDLVIHTGDVAHNARPAEYAMARRVLGALRCPLHVAAGNRDDRAALCAAFPASDPLPSTAGFRQFRVEAGPLRLIAADTLSGRGNKGEFCQMRADALRAALAADATRPVVVFMHHPPFVVQESDYPVQFDSWQSVERLERALDGQRHVIAVLCGHTHRDAAGRLGEVPVRSMPSVAVDLRLGSFAAESSSAPLYSLHRLEGGRALASELRAAR